MQEIRVYFQQDIYSVTLWCDAIVMLMMMLLLLYLCVGDDTSRCQSHLQQYHQLAEDSPFFQTLWWGVKQMGVNMKSFHQKNLLTKARVSWQIQNIFRHQTNKHSRSRYEWTSSYFGVFCGVAQVLQCRSVPERILSNSQQSQIIAQSSVESGS